MQRVIEALESRIAPAAVFTYTEADGDKITIKTTAKINNADFEAYIDSPDNAGFIDGDLTFLDLDDPIFRDTSLTVTAKKAGGGDGKVSIGNIYAPFDLKNVTIKGDLGSLQIGDENLATPGVSKFTVNNLGTSGGSAYFAGAGSIKILGDLMGALYTEGGDISSIKISGDITEGATLEAERFKSIVIGGDVRGRISADSINSLRIDGSIDAESAGGASSGIVEADVIKSVRIGGDIIGGANSGSGGISAEFLGTVTVRGSVLGGSGERSGYIWGDDEIGKVIVSRDVAGGDGFGSGHIGTEGGVGSIQIGGNLAGGNGEDSGWIGSHEDGTIEKISIAGSVIGDSAGSGQIEGGLIGSVRIGKNLEGGEGSNSGAIFASGIASVQIGGSILGGVSFGSGIIDAGGIGSVVVAKDVIAGEGEATGRIYSEDDIGSVKIGGTLEGDQNDSGSIYASNGSIGSITIGKGLTNTGDGQTGIYADGDIGQIVINGDVTTDSYGTLTIRGGYQSLGNSSVESIGSISIKGDVTNLLIGAGLTGGSFVNPDARIGSVNIKGDFTTSSIVAGVDAGIDGFYGTADDSLPSENIAAVYSRIASVVIGGKATGSDVNTEGYGIFAQHIVSLKVNGAKQELTSGETNDLNLTSFEESANIGYAEKPAIIVT